MDVAAIQARMDALRKTVGPKAQVSLVMTNGFYSDSFVSVLIYPSDMMRDPIHANGDSFEDVFRNADEIVAKHAENFARETVRKLAIAVIRITHETGGCTDAQLRGDGFHADEVTRFCEAAVALANQMAEAGPFTVTTTSGSNQMEAA